MSEPIGSDIILDDEWDYEFTCKCGCHSYQLFFDPFFANRKLCVQCNALSKINWKWK